MHALICTQCGSNDVHHDGRGYSCAHCGTHFEADAATEGSSLSVPVEIVFRKAEPAKPDASAVREAIADARIISFGTMAVMLLPLAIIVAIAPGLFSFLWPIAADIVIICLLVYRHLMADFRKKRRTGARRAV